MAERIALIPPESMKMLKHSLNKCCELQGFLSTVDFVAEMFNLGRTYMQTSQVDDFKKDIENGGLKLALDKNTIIKSGGLLWNVYGNGSIRKNESVLKKQHPSFRMGTA